MLPISLDTARQRAAAYAAVAAEAATKIALAAREYRFAEFRLSDNTAHAPLLADAANDVRAPPWITRIAPPMPSLWPTLWPTLLNPPVPCPRLTRKTPPTPSSWAGSAKAARAPTLANADNTPYGRFLAGATRAALPHPPHPPPPVQHPASNTTYAPPTAEAVCTAHALLQPMPLTPLAPPLWL